ncbi:MAG: hypothetical protein JW940_02440 [Polyangiaceae bacterium]|nr:hypothetical protein [Polyangiaceae bacterium]
MKRNLHRLAEERSLALHARIADRLAADATPLERARGRVRRWEQTGSVASPYVVGWRAVLAGSAADVAAFLREPSEHATELRQVSPFAGSITPRERWQIWREQRRRFEAP